MDDRTAYRIAVECIEGKRPSMKELAFDANTAQLRKEYDAPALVAYRQLADAAAILEGKVKQGRMGI